MAFSSSIFSVTQFSSSLASRPSSAISRQTRFPAQIASPDLSPALFDDRRKFVGGVMSLLTKSIKNRVYASINSIDSAATPSYPECSEQLAMGETFGIKAPEKKIDVDIATHIHVKEDGPKRSLLVIETADRPGLVVEMIKVMADVNIDVESAEIDTEGLVAKDKFHVSYQGQALNRSLSQVLVNCLRYFLRRPETDIDSY
ncbi:ACT domain-containing protein [Arabidopsis thaliana]|uniref:ACT domain-containing protein ACR n=1 Tax=Arabidopsis thaliana TaxID=3702 RepID=F4JXP5_ARATH|nr:ACT domain-containing protein [Arabidopsis thaliana]AED90778.1 ACT domain-containing protein [Arabidopsis thaliana]|eukprot:NP_001190227.1 ACT domain-containing protein [Arabidopsis thaliana]